LELTDAGQTRARDEGNLQSAPPSTATTGTATDMQDHRAPPGTSAPLRPLPGLIFASRWLQLPLYLGLIVAQGVYVVHFLIELWHLVEAAAGSQGALQALVTSIGYKATTPPSSLNETVIMLVVLALIDVVMISNLLIMVIVGGYETFVSRMDLEGHPDQPEWLSHVNASVLKPTTTPTGCLSRRPRSTSPSCCRRWPLPSPTG
jgi:uncharacterized membrane protein YqhA